MPVAARALSASAGRLVSSATATAYGPLILIMALTFLLRLSLADSDSYWLDELYSVEAYALRYDNVFDALKALAATSIHPPLYQFILFFWIDLFGASEVATRTLSNIFVTIAIAFVHRTAATLLSEKMANIAALMFSLTYAVTYYGLETRSYGMTVMFAAASTYFLARWLVAAERDRGATGRWFSVSRPLFFLTIANLGLMMTHYYNFFLWAAQGLFILGYLATSRRHRYRLVPGLQALTQLVTQFLIFIIVWGYVVMHSYGRNQGRFEVDEATGVTYTPLRMLNSITVENFDFYAMPSHLALLALLALLVIGAWRGTNASTLRPRILLLASLVTLPFVVGYVVFFVFETERFNPRYVLYVLPAMTLVVGYATKVLVELLARALSAYRAGAGERVYRAVAARPIVAGLVLASLLVVPGAVGAAQAPKADWRGMASQITDVVANDPEHSYFIIESSFRKTPTFDHYFKREGVDLRIDDTIRRSQERAGSFSFEENYEVMEQDDFLIVIFVHQKIEDFPLSLALLGERYERRYSDIGADGRGIIIYDMRQPKVGAAARASQ
jgi:uncharacterized membrane protein